MAARIILDAALCDLAVFKMLGGVCGGSAHCDIIAAEKRLYLVLQIIFFAEIAWCGFEDEVSKVLPFSPMSGAYKRHILYAAKG